LAVFRLFFNEYIENKMNISDSGLKEKPVQLIIEKTPFSIRVREKNFYSANPIEKGTANKREIYEFSLRSRRNAKYMLESASRGMTTAITLTYPIEVKSVMDARRLNRDRDVFIKAYKREYGDKVRYVWMKELQANGNPHYHLMTDCQADVKDQEWFIRNAWYEIVGSDLIKHFYNGVYCDKIRSQAGYASYLTKYLSKMDAQKVIPAEIGKIGRFWGGSRNAFEIEKEEHTFEDSMEGVRCARRYLRLLKKYRASVLREAGKKRGIKYNLKKASGGFILWSGRSAYDKIAAFAKQSNEVPW
jgi:hypothetical protein